MKTTRVVILLATPPGYLSAYYATRAEALDVIEGWRKRQQERIDNGQWNDTEISLHIATDTEDPARIALAVMAKFVIGMYLPDEAPNMTERHIQAVEKIAANMTGGDEWKGEE